MTEPQGPKTTPGAYRPGRHRRAGHVARQLQKRRESFGARWKRDPGREAALLLILAVALITVGTAAVTAKTWSFAGLGRGADDTFWMESAQRFRYVRMVAEGGVIPRIDTHLQTPDGYPPFADTVLQEWIYGRLARLFQDPDEGLAAFVRRLSRLVAATAVVPMALLGYALTRRRDAALIAAIVFGLCLGVAGRGNGSVIFREDLAWPVVLWHLGFLGLWARKQTVPRALAAGVCLLAALLLWKVVTFYALLLVVYLASVFLVGRVEPRDAALGTLAILGPAALGTFLPFSLAHDGFLTSTPMVVGLAVVVTAAVAWRAAIPAAARWALLVGIVALGKVLLPAETGYDHAWETIFAKIRTFDVKPLDPSSLSFHARHYWTGNYESPTLRRLARDWPWVALVALPGVVALIRELRGRTAPSVLRPPPTKLLDGDGPLDPLPPALAWFALWLGTGFLAVYLLFSKLILFAATAFATLVALGFAAPVRLRRTRRLVLGVGVLAVVLHGAGRLPGLEGRFATQDDQDGWSSVVVFTSGAFSDLVQSLATETSPGEPILASFIVSPFLSTYVDRPTPLHCFFEGDLLDRLEHVINARFQSEEALWEAARAYGAVWYLHEPHHLLRTDPRMAQRYVANAMDWPADSVLARMQYAPEELEHFELAWENDWFRLFRVLPPDTSPRPPATSSGAPIWSRPLFTGLFGDPLAPIEPTIAGLDPSDLLYSTLRAEAWLRFGRANRSEEAPLLRLPEQELGFQKAVEIAPYLVEPHELLVSMYTAAGKPARAAEHRRRAAEAKAALIGRHRIDAALAPRPVPRLP